MGRRLCLLPLVLALGLQAPVSAQALATATARDGESLTGPRSALQKNWIGIRSLPAATEILVMAGHADSQGITGSGTSGAAVALAGAAPMQPGITDELYWTLAVAQAVAARGQLRGLNIRYYEPPLRTIRNQDDPRTNWSVGKRHVRSGGYALEIHFDAYGASGVGSGVIPALQGPFTRVDESLASAFGAYPMWFRGGLGGPRRGITLLEIGKLEGTLEATLRDPSRREAAIIFIADRIVLALADGLDQPLVSPPPRGVGSVPPGRGLPANSGGG